MHMKVLGKQILWFFCICYTFMRCILQSQDKLLDLTNTVYANTDLSKTGRTCVPEKLALLTQERSFMFILGFQYCLMSKAFCLIRWTKGFRGTLHGKLIWSPNFCIFLSQSFKTLDKYDSLVNKKTKKLIHLVWFCITDLKSFLFLSIANSQELLMFLRSIHEKVFRTLIHLIPSTSINVLCP